MYIYIYISKYINLKFSLLRDPLFFVKNQVIQASRRSSGKAITQVPWLSNSSQTWQVDIDMGRSAWKNGDQ